MNSGDVDGEAAVWVTLPLAINVASGLVAPLTSASAMQLTLPVWKPAVRMCTSAATTCSIWMGLSVLSASSWGSTVMATPPISVQLGWTNRRCRRLNDRRNWTALGTVTGLTAIVLAGRAAVCLLKRLAAVMSNESERKAAEDNAQPDED